jgi:prepilin-type N-terminal cleavage/methylation domain-containing protein
MSKSKGFTLIELLVVIAIIGILSSVVLASLNTARAKGADAAAKANLVGAKAQAELFYDVNGSQYDGGTATTSVCNTSGLVSATKGINAQVLAAAQATGGTAATVSVDNAGPATVILGICNDVGSTGWAAEIKLKGGNFFCVDSTGSSRDNASAGLTTASDITCN